MYEKNHCRFALLPVIFLLLSGCATVLKTASGSFPPGTWNGETLVQTKYGLVEGIKDREKTLVWKGIPYAQAPVGVLRWRAPREHLPWEGVLRADTFGSASPQNLSLLGYIGSEDSLYLNVWRPETPEKNLPVYVYIHGGGNSIGMSHFPEYQGYAAASRSNMVFVSVNYRLGALGWFRYPALAEGASPEDASGNFGTLDLILSLKWIRDNIASFGGDPGRVTVSGESAGALNILSLLLSPLAEGLFHGAVIESGYAGISKIETAEKASQNLLARLLVRDGKAKNIEAANVLCASMKPAEIGAYLRSKTSRELLAILGENSHSMGMLNYPTVYPDGHVIPAQGFKAFADGTYPVKVPVIIGTNKDETKLFMSFGNDARLKSDKYDSLARYRTDAWRYRGVDAIADAITGIEGHPPIYSYRFDWGSRNAQGISPLPSDMGARIGAFHTIEVPFFLGTDTNSVTWLAGNYYTEANRLGRLDLSAAIMSYLASFAKTGNPNPETPGKNPEWVPFESGKPNAIVFDVDGNKTSISTIQEVITAEALRERAILELKEPELSTELKALDEILNE